MAITKITAPSSTPTAVADYEAQNNHITAFINQINSQAFILSSPDGTTEPAIVQGSYINHGGSLYVVDASDESITGSPSDGSVYIRVSGTTTLTAEYITDISSYANNPANGNLESGSYTLLPYLLVKSGTSWMKYRLDAYKGAIYRMDQNLRTTDSPTFASVNTGQGDNELYAMDQDVKTTDNVEFNEIQVNDSMRVDGPIYAKRNATASAYDAGAVIFDGYMFTDRIIDGKTTFYNGVIARYFGGKTFSYDLTVSNCWVIKNGVLPYVVHDTPEVINFPAQDPVYQLLVIPIRD